MNQVKYERRNEHDKNSTKASIAHHRGSRIGNCDHRRFSIQDIRSSYNKPIDRRASPGEQPRYKRFDFNALNFIECAGLRFSQRSAGCP